MMIVEKDKMSAPSSRERAQRLFDKNLELEKKRHRSAQAQVPSDPNIWPQLRENYEAIILEDHVFSEKHGIEFALWQLHYKRIEELRAHFNAALNAASSKSSQGGKGPVRSERITKIRLQLKTFLSEATGFYHDLIMKIKAKNGLPLGYFEESENRIVMEKDGKKSAEMKQSLISCHRCLIYLGDLARYKGLYGEGDSKKREFTAASSYYLQAASIWPSSGNPHHQLALLASYSGDELATVYRYFRSLAVDIPSSTARDNLTIIFEKNRQSYSQLSGDVKAVAVKESSGQLARTGRGKVEAKLVTRGNGNGVEANPKNGVTNILETYKSFYTRFVRLNGILFTRTSLETFNEVLSLVSTGLHELLSSGQDEVLNFGQDALENGLAIVRIISIVVFTVHNAKKESEGQTYAEIVQRAVLLQNAFTAAFKLMSIIVERCVQLQDPSCSYLLPGILVFVEWLACYPDHAAGNDVDENQATVRSKFWNLCISLLNRLLSVGSMFLEDDEELTCFNNMRRYEEGESDNRLALWEDFELRGFVPLLPAQTILDFSRKHSLGSDGGKERRARVKRIFAAGKALANVVRIDQRTIYFDSKEKKFIISVEAPVSDDFVLGSGVPVVNDLLKENAADKAKLGIVQPDHHQYVEGEDDDEVIVFKPLVAEKRSDIVGGSSGVAHNGLESVPTVSSGDIKLNFSSFNTSNGGNQQAFLPASVGGILPQLLHPGQQHSSRWLEERMSLANSFDGLGFLDNGHVVKPELPLHEAASIFNHFSLGVPNQQSTSTGTSSFYSLSNAENLMISSKVDTVASSGLMTDNSSVKPSSVLQTGLKKSPVSRPSRHHGPPPGFSHPPPPPGFGHVSPKLDMESTVSGSISGNPVMDDYSWLDGYQLPPSAKGLGHDGPVTYTTSNSQQVNNNNLSGTACFPFPGKQVSSALQGAKPNGWQDYHTSELLKAHHPQQVQPQQLPLTNGNQHYTPHPEQYQGQSIWTGRYFV